MRTRTAFRLAWTLWATSLSLSILALIFGVLARVGWEGLYDGFTATFMTFLFGTIGALVGSRRPGNAIGWLFLAFAILHALTISGDGYADYALVAEGLPGGEVLAWFTEWSWMPTLALLIPFLLLLFPDGQVLSTRWRWVGWASATGIVLVVATSAAAMWPVRHEIASGAVTIDDPPASVFAVTVIVAGFAIVVIGALASVVSLILRFKRSRGEQRQQLKWFTYAGTLAFAGTMSVLPPVNLPEASLEIGITAVPVATGVAILKYRLYDIDRIINRTLVYGALTLLLAGVYVGVVVGLGTLVGESTLLVAASTLLVAALFRPARSRVQTLIDRRFYRRKYDAVRTLDAFTARLRDEVDLDALRADLVSVAQEAMQPAHASLWLRDVS